MANGAKERFTGRAGTVERMPIPETDSWKHAVHIDSWLADCPGQSPAWRYYVLSAVSLRDVEGQDKPPERRTPESTHEIQVVALNPDMKPEPTADVVMNGGAYDILWPPNVLMQIEDCTDDDCRELLTLLAQGVAHGLLPAEPPFSNPHHEPTWRQVIDDTLEHMKLGGHPEAEA